MLPGRDATADFNKKSKVVRNNTNQAVSAIKSIAESIPNDARRMHDTKMRADEIALRMDS